MSVVSRQTTLLGLVSWVVPFVVSFLFFDRNGQLVIPQPLFKSVMIVLFGGVGAVLLVLAFRRIAPTTRSGMLLGCYWLAINLVLDLALLLPLTKMPVVDYVYDIGLRYLLIPVMSTAIANVAQRWTTSGTTAREP